MASADWSPASGTSEDAALAMALAREEEAMEEAMLRDEAFAMSLAREYDLVSTQDFGGFGAHVPGSPAAAAAAVLVASAGPGGDEASIATAAALQLEELFGRHPWRRAFPQAPRDDRPQAPAPPSQEAIARLPTRRASGRMLEEDCPVCFCTYSEGDDVRTLPCLHAFHADCIDRWLTSHRSGARSCPVCHTDVGI